MITFIVNGKEITIRSYYDGYLIGIGFSILKEIYALVMSGKIPIVINKLSKLETIYFPSLKKIEYETENGKLETLIISEFDKIINTDEMEDHFIEFVSNLPFNPYDGNEAGTNYNIDFYEKEIILKGSLNEHGFQDMVYHVKNFNKWSREYCCGWKARMLIENNNGDEYEYN